MHAGDDPVAHLHYYKFNEKESGPIKAKIAKDLPEIVADATRRKARLEADVRDLEARVRNPQQYEQDLLAQINDADAVVEQRKTEAKGVTSKPKKDLSGSDLERREAFDAAKKEAREISKRLEAHRTITNLRGEIEAKENQVADLEKQHSEIKLTQYPKGPERDEARARRDGLGQQAAELRLELKKQKALLKSEGDIGKTIENKKRALAEAEAIAALTPETAATLFDAANGYFSFDKGFVEKGEHDTYRPIMNEELHRFYVRQTIEHLQRQHGDNWVEELEKLNEARYRANLMERIGALVDKLPD
jgi:chromosome segregation ATPase